MWQIILTFLFAYLCYIFIKHVLHTNKINSSIKWIDGPKPLPLIGNALDLKDTTYMLTSLENYMIQYNGVIKLSVGLEPAQLYLTDLDWLKTFMTSMSAIDKAVDYNYMHRWLNFGLLTSTGSKWQQRRKLLTPTFHFSILERFIEIFNTTTDVLVEKLNEKIDDDSVDIYPYVTLCTLDILCESAMGVKVNAQTNHESEYIKCIKTMGEIVIGRAVSPIKQTDFFYNFTLDSFKEKKALKVLHDVTRKVIRDRRQQLSNGSDHKKTFNDDGTKKCSPFLDTLIQGTIDGEKLSDEDIREEVDTFLFAGHDTTSCAISFALYALSTHLDIQEKVSEELKQIFEDNKEKQPTYGDLQNMRYLEMVIKESMRLYTTVPIIGRQLSEDVEHNGKIYPAGLNITLFLFGVHRHPDLYPDPLKFDPERFTIDNQIKRHPFAYIPFSAGPRNCIGQKFAMLEIKATISKILRHYVLQPVEGYRPILSAELTLKSRNGIKIKLRPR